LKQSVTQIRTDTDQIRSDSDAFDFVQNSLQKITGIPAAPVFDEAIKEISAMGATFEDMKAGYEWFRAQKKTLKFYGSLVGPTRTAMARRLGDKNNWQPENQPLVRHVSNGMVVT